MNTLNFMALLPENLLPKCDFKITEICALEYCVLEKWLLYTLPCTNFVSVFEHTSTRGFLST